MTELFDFGLFLLLLLLFFKLITIDGTFMILVHISVRWARLALIDARLVPMFATSIVSRRSSVCIARDLSFLSVSLGCVYGSLNIRRALRLSNTSSRPHRGQEMRDVWKKHSRHVGKWDQPGSLPSYIFNDKTSAFSSSHTPSHIVE